MYQYVGVHMLCSPHQFTMTMTKPIDNTGGVTLKHARSAVIQCDILDIPWQNERK